MHRMKAVVPAAPSDIRFEEIRRSARSVIAAFVSVEWAVRLQLSLTSMSAT
jgi:hypothetical protein